MEQGTVWEKQSAGDEKAAGRRELTGKMGHSVPSDCAGAGLRAPRQRAAQCRESEGGDDVHGV